MFAFDLWSKFGVFRIPEGITQSAGTYEIPPKTAIGGMMGAILGIEYDDLFNDESFFDFNYSIVLPKGIPRTRPISQNYIKAYTKETHKKVANIKKIDKLSDKRAKEILYIPFSINPFPTIRYLLIDPTYLVFISNFKYENEIINSLKNHSTKYPLYMGNSEFPANYRFVDCFYEKKKIKKTNSTTAHIENIQIEVGKKYKSMYAATRIITGRKYKAFKNIVFSDEQILFKKKIDGYIISTGTGDFYCDFV